MISFGGSFSGSSSRSRSTTSQNVWDQQAPFLTSMYQQAANLTDQQGGIGPYAQQLLGGIQQGQGDYANAATNPAIANLMQRSQQSNPFLDQQIQGFGADLGQFFQQQILPGIASGAGQAGGQAGGSRQSIAQGMAAQDLQRQFSQGANQLRSGAYQQGGEAAAQAGALAGQSVGQGQGQFNLGLSPYGAAWQPLQQYANVMGGPVVLGQGNSSAGSWSAGTSGNFGIGSMGGCYLARAAFGENSPEWRFFWLWKETDAPAWLRSAYDRHAQYLAGWLTGRAWLRSIVRRAMRWAF